LALAIWRKWILLGMMMLFSVGLSAGGQGHAAVQTESVSIGSQLQQMFESFDGTGMAASAVLQVEAARLSLHKAVVPFYRQRAYRPAWFRDGRISREARQWIEHLQGIAAEGLRPADYHVETLVTCLESIRLLQSYGAECESIGLALVDLLLTDAFLKYTSHLFAGRIAAHRAVPVVRHSNSGRLDALGVLRKAMRSRDVRAVLEELLPYGEEYRRLTVYLAYYRRLAYAGGWPVLPDGPAVRYGDRDARVPHLRRFLVLVGDLAQVHASPSRLMDGAVVKALKRFQARHGLRPDGILGEDTLEQINVPVARRVEQLNLNLERERQPDQDQDANVRYLQVDITDFTLKVVDGGREIMRMPVVVGTSFRRTPVFSALMSYLVFAPYWTVPPTILEEDKLPLLRKDPSYLESHHYEIVAWGKDPDRIIDAATIDWKKMTAKNFPGMLRQKPGPWNPLGKVKFMFPNAYHVYLHDTPAQYLFDKQRRTFSSGCIRIARPLELALYLLKGQEGWTEERIQKEMEGSKPYTVGLKRPIPVHIVYRTAWVDAQGRLQFRKDVYQRDPELRAELQQGPGISRSVSGMPPRAAPDVFEDDAEIGVIGVR